MLRILVVDDELSMREYLELLLTREGYAVTVAKDATEAASQLGRGDFDLVISDMKLGSQSGMDVLKSARASAGPPEVILITAFGTPAAAVTAMREGAYDYICKPFDNDELKLLVQKAGEKRELRRENANLRQTLEPGRTWVGRSAAMRAAWTMVEKVASAKTTVLITGESGTGKELVARAIHLRSSRAGQPFLPVNCAAINEGVLESELFGHMRGSFTGATQDRPGILVAAKEGTVFLDEIGEVPASIQVKLLRVLQEKSVKPVGGSQEIPFRARILAATNRNLEAEVRAGRFREDLLYRLNVITIDLKPLRERPDDIPPLIEQILGKLREELARPELKFSEEALALLLRYPFPGNVRQLQNIIERAATLADGDSMGPESLPPTVSGLQETATLGNGELALPQGFSLERFLDDAERRYLLAALDRTGGVKVRAAETLGLSFRSFRYRLAKHGLGDREET